MSRLFGSLLFFALSVSSAWAQGTTTDDRPAKLREYLAAAAALGQFSGNVLVAEEGRVLIDTAYGLANIELGVRNTSETRFRVASITKQFTAMAIMMLAEEGKLSVADPIAMWVDSLPPAWSRITIHQLLRHTSGISDYEEWFDGYTTQAYSDYMSQAHAPARIIRDAQLKPLDHEPGTQFRYSNSAYIVLGYIIERASGMTYDEFLRQRIHDPLGMSNSLQDRSELLIADRAQGYRFRPGAYPSSFFNGLQREDYHNAVYLLMDPPQADAGLITTARDLYKWDQAHYAGRLVKQSSLDSIFTAGIGGYGYGWFIGDGENGRTHEHSGGLPGFSAYIMRMPETRRTVIVLQNIERSIPIPQDLAAILRGVPVANPRARKLMPRDLTRDAALVGTYRSPTGDSVHVFVQNGILGIHQPGVFRVPIYSEGGGAYFSPQDRAEVHFVETDGHITLTIRDPFGNTRLVAERRAPAPSAALRPGTQPASISLQHRVPKVDRFHVVDVRVREERRDELRVSLHPYDHCGDQRVFLSDRQGSGPDVRLHTRDRLFSRQGPAILIYAPSRTSLLEADEGPAPVIIDFADQHGRTGACL